MNDWSSNRLLVAASLVIIVAVVSYLRACNRNDWLVAWYHWLRVVVVGYLLGDWGQRLLIAASRIVGVSHLWGYWLVASGRVVVVSLLLNDWLLVATSGIVVVSWLDWRLVGLLVGRKLLKT